MVKSSRSYGDYRFIYVSHYHTSRAWFLDGTFPQSCHTYLLFIEVWMMKLNHKMDVLWMP